MHQTCQGSYLYSKTGSQTTIKALWNTIICNSKGNENILLFWKTYNGLQKRNIKIAKLIVYQNLVF